MHDNNTAELLYGYMPKPDAKVPPLSIPNRLTENDSKKLIDPKESADTCDLLANLTFS